jgi:hypothetical protein
MKTAEEFFHEKYRSGERARGSCRNSKKIMVEATGGCNINQGKYAKRIKSRKFENKFCRLA